MDIGTSTVVVELVDLGSGRSLGRAAAMNAQVPFGSDVVSRITFASQDPSNLERLGAVIRGQVDGMIRDLARARGVDSGSHLRDRDRREHRHEPYLPRRPGVDAGAARRFTASSPPRPRPARATSASASIPRRRVYVGAQHRELRRRRHFGRAGGH